MRLTAVSHFSPTDLLHIGITDLLHTKMYIYIFVHSSTNEITRETA